MNKQRRKDIGDAMDIANTAKVRIAELATKFTEAANDMKASNTAEARKAIAELHAALTGEGGIDGQIADAKNAIETAKDEEQDYYDNMPENMRDGDKGSIAQEAVSSLEECYGKLDEAEDEVSNMASTLEPMVEDDYDFTEDDADTVEGLSDTCGEIESMIDEAEGYADSATSG